MNKQFNIGDKLSPEDIEVGMIISIVKGCFVWGECTIVESKGNLIGFTTPDFDGDIFYYQGFKGDCSMKFTFKGYVEEDIKTPTLREAAQEIMLNSAMKWSEGNYETSCMQLRTFNDDNYYSPFATKDNPVYMPATPVGDSNWKLIPKQDKELSHVSSTQQQSVLDEQSIAEAIKTLSRASQELSTHVTVDGKGNVTVYSDYHQEDLVFDTAEKLVQYIECVKQMNSFVKK